MSIVINGVSGRLGRRVAELVLARTSDVILLTRTPEAAADLGGGELRRADFGEPASLPAAFAGGEKLLLVSLDTIGTRVPLHKAAIAAAVEAGVKHIVYTSIPNPTPENPAIVAAEHAETEQAILDSGLTYTFLRNSIYADLQVADLQAAIASGKLVTNTGDGRIAYVTREDCAQVAAAVLLGEGHENAIYDVTGPEALSADDLAAIYAELGGRPVEVVQVDDEAYAAGLAEATGMPPEVAAGYATFGTANRVGALSVVTDVVERLTGRPPIALRDFLASAR